MEFNRVVTMLADWPERAARDRIRSLFACPDIATDLRWKLCDHLWAERHEEMVALVLVAGQLAGDRDLVRRVLRWLAQEPHPADRPLFQWAAFQEGDWELPYWALQGLEQLGEANEALDQRLEELARSPHSLLRLQAAGALAARGNRDGLAEIAHAATTEEDPCVRGEAIRVLGQLRPGEHLDLIRRALWAEGSVFEAVSDEYVPIAEEAALALGRIGTPEAMTELLHGFLFLPEWPWHHHLAQLTVRWALETLVARMDGGSRAFSTLPCIGRRWWFFRPYPEPSFILSR